MPTLFGTSGIRGSADLLFTDQFSFDIGRTFAKFLSKYNQIGYVAIGMDPRESSPRIKKSLCAGIFYEGFEAVDEGVTPVPSMCYLLQADPGCAGSIMVTGSHIKAELNGVKFFFNKEEILKKHEVEIDKIYQEIKEKAKFADTSKNPLNSNKAKEEYKELLRQIAPKSYPNWKVIVDPGGGAQSDTVSHVLSELGVEVIEANSTVQGIFMARDTESKEDFNSLCEEVIKASADFGIGFDSDGDRTIFVDSKGNFIPGDYSASIIAKYAQWDKIVTPITTSQVVESIGKTIIRTRVGSPFVVEAMKKNNVKFGFEANGGGVSGEIMYTRDGGTTAIKFLNVLAKNNSTLEEEIAKLPKFYINKTKIDYKWELKDKILKGAREEFHGVRVEEVDGLKIWVDEASWLLFRSSSNAPEFRIFAESADEKKSKELLAKGSDFVRKMISI